MKILVTGGAGFIGSHLVRMLIQHGHEHVVVVDALTYAGFLENISDCIQDTRCSFIHGSVTDEGLMLQVLTDHNIEAVFHLAAETHVDRSITSAQPFVESNIVGTFAVVEAIRKTGRHIRLIHVSTDEVYGSLSVDAAPFTEQSPLCPSSPYAASKASADMIVQSFVSTYGLDAVITRCCNNYGPRQYPEKLIPLVTKRAIEGKLLPVYGKGMQRREWIYVEDHCSALIAVLQYGKTGETYNIGTGHEEANISVVNRIVQLTGANKEQITFVTDRPAHDYRYALDSRKITIHCGWKPSTDFDNGLQTTVLWYQQQST